MSVVNQFGLVQFDGGVGFVIVIYDVGVQFQLVGVEMWIDGFFLIWFVVIVVVDVVNGSLWLILWLLVLNCWQVLGLSCVGSIFYVFYGVVVLFGVVMVLWVILFGGVVVFDVGSMIVCYCQDGWEVGRYGGY